MKKLNIFLSIVLFTVISILYASCKEEEIELIHHDFNISHTLERESTCINQQVLVSVKSKDFDTKNKSEIKATFKLISGNGKFIYQDQEYQSGESVVMTFAHPTKKGTLQDFDFYFSPSDTGLHKFELEAKTDKVTKSIAIQVSAITPSWSFVVPKGEGCALDKDYSFNIELLEEKKLNNTYFGYYRLLGNCEASLSVNDRTVKQTDSIHFKAGNNVASINFKNEGESRIEFTLYDQFDIKQIDTAIFHAGTVMSPITLSVDKTSQTVSVGQAANINVSVAEENYSDVFKIEYQMISGAGTFSGQSAQTVSAGTHKFSFTPATEGIHTFRLKVTDNYDQSKEQTVTVIGENTPLMAVFNQTNVSLTQGETAEFSLTVSEENYNGNFHIQYTASPAQSGTFFINNSVLGDGIKTGINANKNTIKFKPSMVGLITLDVFVSDDKGQVRNFKLYITVKNTITISATEGGTVEGGGTFEYGTNANLLAYTSEGYTFDGWYENGQKATSNVIYTFQVTKNRTLEARFKIKTYTINTSGIKCSVTGAGTYDHGVTVKLKATPLAGTNFLGWYENDTIRFSAVEYEFTATKDRNLVAKGAENLYNVLVNASTGGEVTGGGTFKTGETVAVVATASEGYAFDGWYENNTKISNTSTYEFTVSKERNLEARFIANKYNIVVNAGTGGTVTGSGSFSYGSTTTITATEGTGYTFDGWYENNTKVNNNLIYTFKVSNDIELEARFSPIQYSITVSTAGGGVVTGGGLYNYGTTTSLQATAKTGYTFEGWYEGNTRVSTTRVFNFTVEGNRVLEARFSKDPYLITITTAGGGNVNGGGMYNEGASVSVVATANEGYTFDGWYENGTKVNTSTTYTFIAALDRNLTAKFVIKTFIVSLTTTEGGIATGAGTFNYGTSATLKATPNNGYTFDGWYENNSKISSLMSYQHTVSKNASLQAKFIKKQFTFILSATTGGVVSGTNSGTYEYNRAIEATATPSANYTFDGWYKNNIKVGNSSKYTFLIDENTSLEAKFTIEQFTIQINETEGGTNLGAGVYNYGSTATVSASANNNYTFIGWYENGELISTNLNYSFAVSKNRILEPRFEIAQKTILVSATTGGSAKGGGTYNYGSNISLVALAESDYNFVGWYENNTKVHGEIIYNFNVSVNRNLTAKFTPKNYTISLTKETGGNVGGSGSYAYNTNATITATPNTGYTFDGWYENGTKISSSMSFSFTVKGNRSVTAKFIINKYTVTTSKENESWGSVTGAGTFNYGTSATLKATPNTGRIFDGWYINGSKVSSNATYTFTVTKNITVTAKFSSTKNTLTLSRSTTPSTSTGGSVTGDGTYNYGTSVRIEANTYSGYQFDGWYEGTTKVSSSPYYSTTLNSNRTLQARWTRTYTVKLFYCDDHTQQPITTPDSDITLNGAGTYRHGTNVTVSTSIVGNHIWHSWHTGQNCKDHLNSYHTANKSFSFTITENKEFTAGYKY